MSGVTTNGSATSAVRIDRALRERVLDKWQRLPQELAWGDRLDARFYLAATLGQLRGLRVLDIGCNAGVLLSEVDATNWKVGLDRGPQVLELAQGQFRDARYLQADMAHLPFAEASFDVVICGGMLELPPPREKAAFVQEVARVLKRAGRLYLTTPNRRNLHYRVRDLDAVTYEELVELLMRDFDVQILGFNPFPAFPRFLPNRWLAVIPGIWSSLVFLMAHRVNLQGCCAFYVEGMKR